MHPVCFRIKKILSLPPQNDETFIEKYADIAQLVEQLICNQPVVGSSPTIGSGIDETTMGEFQSGQMGQTVNLLAKPSEVRILPLPLVFFSPAEVAHPVERQPSKL